MDCSDASLEEMNQTIEACERNVRSQPEKSVYTLIVAGGSSFNDNSPHGTGPGQYSLRHAYAIVGVSGLYKVVLSAVAMFSKCRF